MSKTNENEVALGAGFDKETIENIFNSKDSFTGERQNTLSEYVHKEEWLRIKNKVINVLFTGKTTVTQDEEGKDVVAVVFYSDYKVSGKPELYKAAASNLVRGLRDGGAGKYAVICKGEEKNRNGKKGTYLDFETEKFV